jgi:AraC-like DNA-binding protein
MPTPPRTLVRLCRARDLLRDCLAEPVTLADCAAEAELSPWHLLRAFRETFGETPREFLTRLRIERAKDLLRAANLTVTEICMLVGFESLGSFSTRFRELVDCTPSEYRRAAVANGGPPQIPGCFVLMWTRPGR